LKTVIIYFIVTIAYFLILYLVAFLSNRHYREKDDFLFVSKSQWKAIMIMWLPVLVALIKR
jgi:hypothetical protein